MTCVGDSSSSPSGWPSNPSSVSRSDAADRGASASPIVPIVTGPDIAERLPVVETEFRRDAGGVAEVGMAIEREVRDVQGEVVVTEPSAATRSSPTSGP